MKINLIIKFVAFIANQLYIYFFYEITLWSSELPNLIFLNPICISQIISLMILIWKSNPSQKHLMFYLFSNPKWLNDKKYWILFFNFILHNQYFLKKLNIILNINYTLYSLQLIHQILFIIALLHPIFCKVSEINFIIFNHALKNIYFLFAVWNCAIIIKTVFDSYFFYVYVGY